MARRHLFIGGLHRSGTSLVHRLIAAHPCISGLRNTGVPQDEGQHLQDEFPPAKDFGGPGKFARAEEMHLTEEDVGSVSNVRERLMECWSPYWEPGRLVYAEKSPPNLIKARYLQKVFGDPMFLMIVRHPLAVAEATQKMRQRPVPKHVGHWTKAYRLMLDDMAYLRDVRVMRYEDFCAAPGPTLSVVFSFLGLESIPPLEEVHDSNASYLDKWIAPGGDRGKHSRPMTAFGYSLEGPNFVGDPQFFAPFKHAEASLIRPS